jgi:hypothetical protein
MAQVTPQFEVENSRFVHNMLYLLLNIVVLKLFTGQQCSFFNKRHKHKQSSPTFGKIVIPLSEKPWIN